MKTKLKLAILLTLIFIGKSYSQSFQRQYYLPAMEPFRTPNTNWGLFGPSLTHHPVSGSSTIFATYLNASFSPPAFPPPFQSITPISFMTRIDARGHVKFCKQAPSLFRFFDPSNRKFYPISREELILTQNGTTYYPLDSAIQKPSHRTFLTYLDSSLLAKWTAMYGFISGSIAKTIGFGGVVEHENQLMVLFNGETGPFNAITGARSWIGFLRRDNGSLDSGLVLQTYNQLSYSWIGVESFQSLNDTTLTFQWQVKPSLSDPTRTWNVFFNRRLSNFRYLSTSVQLLKKALL